MDVHKCHIQTLIFATTRSLPVCLQCATFLVCVQVRESKLMFYDNTRVVQQAFHRFVQMPYSIPNFLPVCLQCATLKALQRKLSYLLPGLITIATLKWLLPSVSSLMESIVILQGESLITLDALKWFLPSVSYLVSYKIILRIESLATFVAFLKFCLQCVSSYGCFY